MRRLLLSSLRGAAVWGFRIDGVLHEHQTIPGVVEDVHQIIGQLKTLVLALDADVDTAVLRIRKTEAGPVTAADIQQAPGVRVVEPSHHLFTLQDDRELNVELYVNKGRGYVESDQHPVDRGLPVDLVRIDAIYNPVRRANFAVAETRVGQRTDYDRLTLTVETDGTLTPDEAVSYAAALAQTHFQYFASFGSHAAGSNGAALEGRRRAADGRSPPHADRRSGAVGAERQLAQELERAHAGRSGPAQRRADSAGQELREEVAAGDRRSPGA